VASIKFPLRFFESSGKVNFEDFTTHHAPNVHVFVYYV
jgi:hypothetical protein